MELLSTEDLAEGSQAEFVMKIGPFRRRWLAGHGGIIPGRQFRDVQLSGPFSRWEHTHSTDPAGSGGCRLTDRIDYQIPLGFIGNLLGGRLIRRQLERTFDYRHGVTAQDLAFHSALAKAGTMKIAVGGSTGLVGGALVPFLTTGGHDVVRLARSGGGVVDDSEAIFWSPWDGTIDEAGLEDCDAVVHLGGHNIASGRWGAATKQKIYDSRINSTSLLARTLAGLRHPPRVFVCASAIGFYGDRGDDRMTEDSEPGPSWLSQVCQDWEEATTPASAAGIRVVNLRIGVVLSPKGGALHKMLTPFRLGAGGIVGNGRQWMSWIALDDVVRIIAHCIATETVSGPLNCVASQPVDNRTLTKTLGRVLKRPTIFPLPAFVVRTMFGEMGDELLLGSTLVDNSRLTDFGYDFVFPELEPALRHLLGRS